MRKKLHVLIALCAALLIPFGIVTAQVINDVTFDEDILVNLTGSQTAVAFNLSLDAPAAVTANVRYLGGAFDFMLEIFDADGGTVAEQTITGAGDLSFDLPGGDLIILASLANNQTGRAILRFTPGASTPEIVIDPPVPAEADTFDDGQPRNGEWLATRGEFETNCPDVLTMEDALLPLDDSTHQLTFSTPPTPLEFHVAVAPDEVAEAPEFFMTEAPAENVYEVVPGIQTAPYTYTYIVNSPESITLAYEETLALSDCALLTAVELTWIGEGEAVADAPAPTEPDQASVADWSVLGAMTTSFDETQICGSADAGDPEWFFDAPQSFVDAVVNGYGETLSFDLRHSGEELVQPVRVSLVVGNALLLVYEWSSPATALYTNYSVDLTETAGWVEVDGMFDASDPAMFNQLLSDVTRVQISGLAYGNAETCLRNPRAGGLIAAEGENVPYYVVSRIGDPGDGIPVGCDDYAIALDSGAPFSDDPLDNVVAALTPLLAMGTSNVPGTDFENYLGEQGLSIGELTLENGQLTVVLEGDFLLIGTCGDPLIEAQILLGVFADPRIESALIVVNGESLKTISDMSGQTPAGAAYTRDDIPIRTW